MGRGRGGRVPARDPRNPVKALGEFSRSFNYFRSSERGGADIDVRVGVVGRERIAETLVNVVGEMEPDDTGGPLRIKGRAISPGGGALGAPKVRGAEGEELSRGRTPSSGG